MEQAADGTGTIASWADFLFSHVLPIAVSQIYEWLLDWQVPVAVLLVLAAGFFWSRQVLKSARQAARETVQSETRSIDASLKLLRRQIETQSDAAPRSIAARPSPAPKPPTSEASTSEAPTREPSVRDGRAAIGQLRQAIRLALGTIPLSDDALSPEGARLYKAAIGTLSSISLPAEAKTGTFGQIVAELSALEHDFPPTSCRQAWQSLVKVNALAREYDEPPLTRAQVLAAAAKTQA